MAEENRKNKKYWIFTVNDQTWKEHVKAGIAAINDPYVTHPKNIKRNANRQAAISEIIGIRPGDIIFFNRMRSEQHPPELLGIYKAISKAYYDPSPLFPGAIYVNQNLPFRVQFDCLINFTKPLMMEEIWDLKEKGKIWTIQQTRGDAVGKHACYSITKLEGEIIDRLFKMKNILEEPILQFQRPQVKFNPLPIDLSINNANGALNYEASLMFLLLNDFADGKHKDIFGKYDDFISYVPTGARKEIDILLLKYNGKEILWYQIIEVKKDKFTIKELQTLITYEKWFINNRAETPLQVYTIGIASEFDDNVKKFVSNRANYIDRPIRLIQYKFNAQNNDLQLSEV